MALTFRQLAEQIAQLNEEQLDSNVSVYDADNDEYYGVNDVSFATEECQVLDVGHPILRFRINPMISGVTFVDKNSVYQIPGFIYDEERPEFDCFIPVFTGDFWIVDCWICDKDGNVHPGYDVAGVPIHTEQMVRIGKKPANTMI